MTAPATGARYDGSADWYDAWAQANGATAMAAARATLDELIPTGTGLSLGVGCGTGAVAEVLAFRLRRRPD